MFNWSLYTHTHTHKIENKQNFREQTDGLDKNLKLKNILLKKSSKHFRFLETENYPNLCYVINLSINQ